MQKDNNDIREQIYDGRKAFEMLKAARTTGRRKREISTIARQLCIREEFLEALENGEYSKIPELVYILGFARNYALELELDPKVIIPKIKLEMGLLDDDMYPKRNDDDEEQECASPVSSCAGWATGTAPAPTRTGDASDSSQYFVSRNWKWILSVLAAAAVVIAVVLVASNNKNHGRRLDSRAPSIVAAPATAGIEPAAQPTVPAQTEPRFNLPIREKFGTENRAGATIVLQATAETWLKVEDSRGETLFSRVLSPGDVYYAPAAGSRATVGNAGGLDVFVNGDPAPKIGPAHVRRSGISLTPAGLAPAAAPTPTEVE